MHPAPSRSRSHLLLSLAVLLGGYALILTACGGGAQAGT
jgi:hypothetical protein